MAKILRNMLKQSISQQKCGLCGLASPSFADPIEVKLHFLKCAINQIAPFLAEYEVWSPKRNVSTITKRAFARVRENLRVHSPELFRDGNFPKLLDVAEKVLVWVAEVDGHYRGQLAYLFMSITGEIEKAFREQKASSVEEFCKWLMEHKVLVYGG